MQSKYAPAWSSGGAEGGKVNGSCDREPDMEWYIYAWRFGDYLSISCFNGWKITINNDSLSLSLYLYIIYIMAINIYIYNDYKYICIQQLFVFVGFVLEIADSQWLTLQ